MCYVPGEKLNYKTTSNEGCPKRFRKSLMIYCSTKYLVIFQNWRFEIICTLLKNKNIYGLFVVKEYLPLAIIQIFIWWRQKMKLHTWASKWYRMFLLLNKTKTVLKVVEGFSWKYLNGFHFTQQMHGFVVCLEKVNNKTWVLVYIVSNIEVMPDYCFSYSFCDNIFSFIVSVITFLVKVSIQFA